VPKLLDFGIAKLLDPAQTEADPARTATIMRMMTPDYASPEQVRGAAITTATDVYSLGAVLYELLTGQRPHRFQSYTPTEIERVICETEVERPSQAASKSDWLSAKLRRQLSGDLDNIILMALRKEPDRRYQSVEQFSDDLRRHLEGLPVSGRSDTVGYRAGKFIRRHKVGLAATALVIVSLLGGLIAASHQARRAERRFQQVRKLANTFLFDVHDKIQPLSGSTEARELVVKTALQYLDSLVQESGGDGALQLELAQAYLKVGDVQGEPFLPNLGHTDAAMQSYRKALTLAERLTAQNGMNVAALQALTSAYFKLGALQSELGNKPGAQATLRSGLTVALKTAQQTGEVKDIIRVTNIYSRLGETQLHMGDPATALATYRQSQQISKQRAITHPSDNAQASVAISYENIGQAVGVQGDPANAIANYRQAADLLEPLAAKQPANTYFTRELRTTYTWLSSFHGNPHFLNLGDPDSAMRYIRQSLAISEKLVAADEKNARARLDLMNDYRNLADLLAEAEPQRAIDHYKKALSVIRPLLEASPKDFNLRLSQVDKIIRISDVLQAAGKSSEAETNLLPGLASLRQLENEDATSIEVQANLHYALRVMGKTLTKSRNYAGALPCYRQAIEIAERIAASSPADMRWQWRLANSRTVLAEHYVALAQQPGILAAERIANLRQASSEYQSALAVWDAWSKHGFSSVFNITQRNRTARAAAQCEAALEKLGAAAQR
jgi:tetratricopeptide (TPR) repeat protein